MYDDFDSFDTRRQALEADFEALVTQKNAPLKPGNGIYTRWKNPVLTGSHAPLHWRYDFDKARNPFLMERLGVNAAFNAGAIKLDGEYHLMARTEGNDLSLIHISEPTRR